MKSIIRRILKEEIQKPTFQDVVLKDVMSTFTKEYIESNPRYQWKEVNNEIILKQFERVVNIANNLLIPHIENTYELDIVKDREIIMSVLTQWIRNMYYSEYPMPGDTIEMVKMYDDPDEVEPGTRGVVGDIKSHKFDGKFEEHVEVNWENGRTLKILLPHDKIKIISRNT